MTGEHWSAYDNIAVPDREMVPVGVGEGNVFQRRPVAPHQVQVPDRRHTPARRLRRLSRGWFSFFIPSFSAGKGGEGSESCPMTVPSSSRYPNYN